MTLAIRAYSDADRTRWDDYVASKGEATLFHDRRWTEAVTTGYGYRNVSFLAERDAQIVGVLPLTFVKAPLLGRSLVSTAFSVGGGILADDQDVTDALGAAALDLGRQLGVNYVELRGGPAPNAGYSEKTGVYAGFEKALPAETGAIRAWLPRNRRAEVKKALQLEASGEKALRHTQSVSDFYKVYAPAVRNLGTPVMPRKFLEALQEKFGDDVDLDLVERGGEPVAGLFSFWFRDRVMPYYIGGAASAREIRAYDFLYFKLMERAVERGVKMFDFGRSKIGSTHFKTKTFWGFEPAPIVYHVGLVRARTAPNVNPNNPKFGRFVALWRRTPLPVANIIGPILARNFP